MEAETGKAWAKNEASLSLLLNCILCMCNIIRIAMAVLQKKVIKVTN